MTPWHLKGEWIKNCNCAFGCPCDFNARPTKGHCDGLVAMHVREGHFGKVSLDGVKWVVLVHFPGALHEGNGTIEIIIDERAKQAQRDALFEIFSGKHSEEGTLFHIFSLIVSNVLPPRFAKIGFKFDMEKRRAEISIPGVLTTTVRPIKNPVTGADHHIQINMPAGFEHRLAEVASASISSHAGIKFEVPEGHSSLARVVHRPKGVTNFAAG